MRRRVGWAGRAGGAGGLALVLALMIALGASAAVAAGAPAPLAATQTACSSSEDVVSASAPGFARQGLGVPVSVDATDPAQVSDAQVTLLVGSTIGASTTLASLSTTTQTTLTAPSTGSTLTIAIAWDQDAGTAAACSGTRILKIPLIPAQATAGDPSAPRLTGPFSVVETPFNYRAADSRPTWRFAPACAYFACGVTLTSSQGLQLAMDRQADGLYHGSIRADAAETATSCQVAHLHLATITNAYTLREDVYVRVRKSRDRRASTITGSLIATYTPTRAARKQGCVLSERAVERFTGHS